MITVIKWIGIISAVSSLLYLGAAVSFFQMFNRGPRTEKKVQEESSNSILSSLVSLNEIKREAEPLDYFYESPSLARLESKFYLLESDGSFVEGEAFYDQDLKREYSILHTADYSLILKGNVLCKFTNGKIGDRIKEWDDLGFKGVSYLAAINSSLLLAEVYYEDVHKGELVQLSYPGFKITKLTGDPYYTFARSPLRFESANQQAIVIVYFEGSYSYAFGGDSSRPKKSIVRLYDAGNPAGVDLVALSFASGTIVDIAFEDEALFITADPSRPAQSDKPRTSPRFWRLSLHKMSEAK